MTFEEWWEEHRDGKLAGLEPDDIADAAWHDAQAQCAAGPWRPIAEKPTAYVEVLLGQQKSDEDCSVISVGYWNGERLIDDGGFDFNWTHFAELREVPNAG